MSNQHQTSSPSDHAHDHAHDHAQCRQLLGSLSDYVDGDLADEICAEIERHMAGCDRCRIVVDTLRKTVELYHATADAPATVPPDVRQRLFFRLDLEQFVNQADSKSAAGSAAGS
jgi:anti-sigma factor RsiW